MSTFPYKQGDKVLRKDLHSVVGGSRQGGICSSKQGYILIFSDPKIGHEFGYHDGWSGNHFLYFGSGQEGDMEFSRGNKAILEHKKEKGSIHLFMGSKGEVVYEGQMELDTNNPYELIENNDKNGEERIAIVFRLNPISKRQTHLPNTNLEIHDETKVEDINLERYLKDSFQIKETDARTGSRTESKLLTKYAKFRAQKALPSLTSKIIKIKGEKKTDILRVDGWVEKEQLLIEAKSSCTRNHIRLAIGQLLDYKRFIEPKEMAILLPAKPKQDLLELIHSLKIKTIHQTSSGDFELLDYE